MDAADEHRNARGRLAATQQVSWPIDPFAAAAMTVLLAFAGYFSINATLAAADLAPFEAYLLPAAFGPVLVLATKFFFQFR